MAAATTVMSWAQLLRWSVLLSFAFWASILFGRGSNKDGRDVFLADSLRLERNQVIDRPDKTTNKC